jgi:hypothetical protein
MNNAYLAVEPTQQNDRMEDFACTCGSLKCLYKNVSWKVRCAYTGVGCLGGLFISYLYGSYVSLFSQGFDTKEYVLFMIPAMASPIIGGIAGACLAKNQIDE